MLARQNNHATTLPPSFSSEWDKHDIEFSSDLLQGFIQHPQRFPLHYKKRRFWERMNHSHSQHLSDIGLTFHSSDYHKPGSILDITIPTRRETHDFPAKVVAVQANAEGYEIGVLLLHKEDVPKLRIIEQICHIELYLNDKKYKDGPFVSHEKITEEWIGRFASEFPTH